MGVSNSKDDFEHTAIHSTKYGKVRGRKFNIGDRREVNGFLGIPYARPPVGDYRFKKPAAPETWPNVKECVRQPARAPQVDMMFDKWTMRIPTSEDCLYLNVFAPDWDPFPGQERGRAVLVWIHGGGFVIQSAANYGDQGICKYLCSKGVIIVTLQYRLGILGFGATGDEHCIPNLGLWDQAFALTWVKENIAEFGGDPSNITVFGQSAGGVCADLLSLSPYTRDLFDKVIPMGGTANCSWAMKEVKRVRAAMLSHAYSLGYQIPDNATEEQMNEGMMKYMMTQPVSSLAFGLSGSRKLVKSNISGLMFGPVIDGDFLPASLAELRTQTPKKFCMAGLTDYEMLLFAGFGRSKLDAAKAERLLHEYIPEDKYYNYPEMRKAAKALYIGEKSSSDQTKRACIRIASDLFVTNAVHQYAEDMLSAGHTVYLYNFEYFSPRGFGLLRWSLPFLAATHTTEIPYLFGKGIIEAFRPNDTDHKVIETFTTLFTNFAKHGDPNGGCIQDILPITEYDKWQHICVKESATMKHDFQGRRAEFWKNLLAGKLPFDTSNTKETQTETELDGKARANGAVESPESAREATQTGLAPHYYEIVAGDEEQEAAPGESNENFILGHSSPPLLPFERSGLQDDDAANTTLRYDSSELQPALGEDPLLANEYHRTFRDVATGTREMEYKECSEDLSEEHDINDSIERIPTDVEMDNEKTNSTIVCVEAFGDRIEESEIQGVHASDALQSGNLIGIEQKGMTEKKENLTALDTANDARYQRDGQTAQHYRNNDDSPKAEGSVKDLVLTEMATQTSEHSDVYSMSECSEEAPPPIPKDFPGDDAVPRIENARRERSAESDEDSDWDEFEGKF